MLSVSFSEMTCSLKKTREGTCPNSDRSLQEQGLGLANWALGPILLSLIRAPLSSLTQRLCSARRGDKAWTLHTVKARQGCAQGLSGECPVTVQVISFIEMGFGGQGC